MQAGKEAALAVLEASALGPVHDRALESWYEQAPDSVDEQADLESTVLAQHYCKFRLWALEDEARRDDVDDAYIAGIKRQILEEIYAERAGDVPEVMP